MISVVVVDDSAFMRKALEAMLEKEGDIKVVATARNGEEGLEVIRKHSPDVVTLDIEMPKMDGLTALRHIMMEMPRPVLMVSSLTTEGAEATLKAMELGAVDFIPKQLSKVSLDIVRIEEDLRSKVRMIAKRRVRPFSPARAAVSAVLHRHEQPAAQPAAQARPVLESPARGTASRDLVAIGVSTGGPPAVQRILSELPENFPAGIVIAQHMPAAFTGPFAKRLDTVSKLSVKEAATGDKILPGTVFVAPGGRHLRVELKAGALTCLVNDEPKDALYKPSANVLVSSAAQALGRRALGVILTGMGSDGLEGVRELKQKNGRALAQSDSTCVVYGMPKAIVDAGLADDVVDIEAMSEAILNSVYK